MKKITIILFFMILIFLTAFSATGILNEIANNSRNSDDTLLQEEISLFEDEFVVNIQQSLTEEFFEKTENYTMFLMIANPDGKIIHTTTDCVINAEDFTDIQKEAQFKLIVLYVKKDMTAEISESGNLEALYQKIKDERYYVKFADLFINCFPTACKVDLLHEDLLWNVYIDGVKQKDEIDLTLAPGIHSVSCPQLVLYNTDKRFKHYNILVRDQEDTQLFYLPKKQNAEFEFILNTKSDCLEGKDLEITSINFIPLGKQQVFKEEKLFSGKIKQNKAEICLDKGIQYDNILSIKTRIRDNETEKEIFRKLYPIKNLKQEVQYYDSFVFLDKKQQYEIMVGEDNSVSIMDTEWHTELIPYAVRETTWKTAEEFEEQYRKLEITANQDNVALYLNNTYIGEAPMTLWVSRTDSYIIEAAYNDSSKTIDIIPVTETEKIEFNF